MHPELRKLIEADSVVSARVSAARDRLTSELHDLQQTIRAARDEERRRAAAALDEAVRRAEDTTSLQALQRRDERDAERRRRQAAAAGAIDRAVNSFVLFVRGNDPDRSRR